MKRGTAAKVILGKDTLMDVPAGIVHGTDVILGGKAGLVNDFGGLVLSNNLMLGKKISRSTIITVTVRGQSPLVLPDAIGGSLQAVKAFGGTEQRNVPQGYTQLGGIVFDGSSYIDTGLTSFSNNGVYECDFVTSTLATTFLFGQNPSATSLQVGFFTSSNLVWQYGANLRLTANNSANTAFSIVAENGKLTTNGTTTTGTESASITINQHLFVGAGVAPSANPDSNTPDSRMFVGTINRFKYTLAGVVICDLVPVKRNSDNVLGFYDTIRNTFLTNAGTGTFAAGGEAVPTPDAPMDIVSNNGVLKYGFLYYSDNVTRQLSAENYPGEPGRSITYSDGVLTCEITDVPGTNRGLFPTWSLSFIAGHKYACIVNAKGNTRLNLGAVSVTPSGAITGAGALDTMHPITSDYAWYATPWECNAAATAKLNIRVLGTVVGQYASFKDVLLIDLTAIFGAGNEPTTSSDIIQRTVDIYTDGTVETINAHGKNLFDVSDYDTVSDWQGGNYKYVEIPLPNGTYTVSWDKSKGASSFYWLVQVAGSVKGASNPGPGGSWLWHATIAALQKEKFTFTVTQGKAWFTCSFGSNFDAFLACLRTVQIELGSTDTTYEPYYNGGTATAEMLLKVGDYQDVQSILDGVVTRNVGVKVLDGTENWEFRNQSLSLFYATIASTYFSDSQANHLALSTNFLGVEVNNIDMPNNSCKCASLTYTNSLQLFIKSTNFASSADLKSWLAAQYAAGTPVIVLYPLATPTTESVAGQTLQVTDGDNVLEITQASLTNLELEATYQSLVRLTIQEVEDANLNNNVEVTIS